MHHPAPLPSSLTALDRTLVMGVVNVTPDSFSDGGRWFDTGAAVAHGLELLAQGADILDVGGESTRPGALRVPVDEERRRVLPVVAELVAAGAGVSVDTMRPGVAADAVAAGALIVNDVSGGLADTEMRAVVADTGVVYVAMHWRGPSDVMDDLAVYDDVVRNVRDELALRLDDLIAAGVAREQVVLDPGLGFAKPGSDNWPLLAHLDVLAELDRPVLVGASRKRFLGHLLAGPDGVPVRPDGRDRATRRPAPVGPAPPGRPGGRAAASCPSPASRSRGRDPVPPARVPPRRRSGRPAAGPARPARCAPRRRRPPGRPSRPRGHASASRRRPPRCPQRPPASRRRPARRRRR